MNFTNRNKGTGKKTIDFITEESKKLNINALHLEVESDNDKANHLYTEMGFRGNNRSLLTKIIRVESNI